MKGYWLFIALVALCGCSLFLGIHWGFIVFFHLIWLRIFLIKKRSLIIASILVYALFASIGFWSSKKHFTMLSPEETKFTVSFSEYPKIDGNQLKSIVVTKGNEKVVLKYRIQTEEEKKRLLNHIKSGQTCIVIGKLIKPEDNRNENLFNYKLYLFRQNIHWVMSVTSIMECKEPEKSLVSIIKHFREIGLKKVESKFSTLTIPYVKALLFGDSSDFAEEIYSLYQRLGIVHLLAISGLHVGVVFAGIFYLLTRCGFTREFSSIVLLVFLPFYALLAGANPPVVRSVLMSMLLITSIQKKSPFTTLDALSISFLFFLFKDPFILFNIGFQLSFVVCFSIILAAKSILPRYKHFFTRTMMISFISQVAAIPILSFHFFEFSILSIISNVVYVPYYTIIVLPLLFITYLSTFIFNTSIFTVLECVARWVVLSSEKLGQLLDIKAAVYVTGKPTIIMLLILVVTTQAIFFHLEKGYSLIKSIFPFLIVISLMKMIQIYSPIGEVTFIDVGQGDSIFIRLPFHRGTYLIDTGGQLEFQQEEWMKKRNNFEVGNDIIVPFLKSKGISVIDKMVLTHSDADHISAASTIIEKISLKQILISPNSWEKPLMLNTIEKARRKKIPVEIAKDGMRWSNQSGAFQFVYPFDNEYKGNNDSLVILADVGGKRWLFTGDLEEAGEKELISNHKFEIDILKIGHHGSKSSSSEMFIDQLKPKFAIISAGKSNRYGHPHKEVLKILADHRIQVFRTDQNGAIQYKFFKKDGTFHTILP